MNALRRSPCWLLVFAFVLTFPGSLLAQYVMPGGSPLYSRGARNMAMGGIGVALQNNGKQTPFYNPAGLDDIEDSLIELPFPTNMTIELSTQAIGLLTDTLDLKDALDAASTDAEKIREFDQFVLDHFGEFHTMRVLIPIFSYTRRFFAIGAFLETAAVWSFRDQSYPNFKLEAKTNGGGYVAGGYSLLDHLVQFGSTVKVVYRRDIAQLVDAAMVTSDEGFGGTLENDFENGEVGIGIDIGLKTRFTIPGLMKKDGYKKFINHYRPAFGFTYQDIGNVQYDSTVDEQSISLGMAIYPDFWILKNTVGIDFRDLNQAGEFLSKFHAGAEFKFPWVLALRVGTNQGYIAGGLGLDLWILRLDATVYKEEVGIQTRQYGDFRMLFQLSSEF